MLHVLGSAGDLLRDKVPFDVGFQHMRAKTRSNRCTTDDEA